MAAQIWKDIQTARHYQMEEYGGPENDALNDTDDWIKIRNKQLAKADYPENQDISYRRHYLIQALAVIVAEVRSLDAKYSGRPNTEEDTETI